MKCISTNIRTKNHHWNFISLHSHNQIDVKRCMIMGWCKWCNAKVPTQPSATHQEFPRTRFPNSKYCEQSLIWLNHHYNKCSYIANQYVDKLPILWASHQFSKCRLNYQSLCNIIDNLLITSSAMHWQQYYGR